MTLTKQDVVLVPSPEAAALVARAQDARAEAERRWPAASSGFYEGLVTGFQLGAVWQGERA